MTSPDEKKKNFFLEAAAKGNLSLLQELSRDPDVDYDHRDHQNLTALHHACQNGNAEVVKFLLGLPKLDLNLPNDKGATPFYLACQNAHVEVVLLLLDKLDVVINQACGDESTPLWIASSNGHLAVVEEILLSKREIETKKMSSKKTAAKQASVMGNRKKKITESNEDFARRQENCKKIAELLTSFNRGKLSTRNRILQERQDPQSKKNYHNEFRLI